MPGTITVTLNEHEWTVLGYAIACRLPEAEADPILKGEYNLLFTILERIKAESAAELRRMGR